MERVIVTEGTKVNLYKLFEDLQNYTATNNGNVYGQLFGSFGINALTTSSGSIDPTDTSMQVSGIVGHNYVSIGVGEALTTNYEYLQVTPGLTASLTNLSNGSHTLYAKYQSTYDTPVDVSSGFAYGISGSTNSRAHDGTALVWDTNPTVSGIVLATLTTSGGLLTGTITDRRAENVLKLSTQVLPNIHTQNTDTGTTSSTFRVGNSSATSNDGDLVDTIPGTPMMPLFVRVVDVTSPSMSSVRTPSFDALLESSVRTGLVSQDAAVSLRWNYDNLIGACGRDKDHNFASGKFVIDGSLWTNNEFIGYHLYLPSVNLDYVITANQNYRTEYNTEFTVSPYKHSTPIETINQGTGGIVYDAVIHSNCERYEILIQPVIVGTTATPTQERYEEIISASTGGPVIMQSTTNIFLGEQVIIKVRAVSGSLKSAYATMAAGSYTKNPPFVTIQYYDSPFLVQLPGIDSTSAAIGATATSTGFTVTITGWDIATDFEICYTTDSSGANFTNDTHEKILTRQTSVDVAVSDSSTYYIAVRPLISGQQVATPKTTSITSGAGGNLPAGTALNLGSIALKTYSGTMGTWDSGSGGWIPTTLVTPASSTNTAIKTDSSLVGEIIVFSNGDTAYISAVVALATYNTASWILKTEDGADIGSSAGLSGLTFTINTTEIHRELWSTYNFPVDAKITGLHIDQWSLNTSKAGTPVLRWYQGTMKDFCNEVPLAKTGQATYDPTSSVTVLSANGPRTLIIDLWDETDIDSTSTNLFGFSGNIIVYWKPYSDSGTSTSTVITPTPQS